MHVTKFCKTYHIFTLKLWNVHVIHFHYRIALKSMELEHNQVTINTELKMQKTPLLLSRELAVLMFQSLLTRPARNPASVLICDCAFGWLLMSYRNINHICM
ncbi:Hypothetical_protein [Hexamita inflata]|uniref:Hypothetical_protein n=1 Tax=Hexamita inflata TaxID=28002 RepID=A0AA86NXT3_9EUKA|nr:Hypothetical protein HINF_LOCUS14349 [Hexamita inflata]